MSTFLKLFFVSFTVVFNMSATVIVLSPEKKQGSSCETESNLDSLGFHALVASELQMFGTRIENEKSTETAQKQRELYYQALKRIQNGSASSEKKEYEKLPLDEKIIQLRQLAKNMNPYCEQQKSATYFIS